MENKKIRVAITHGDTNGIGYEMIFKTFAAPEMLELCTPIIYGSPKLAAYHSKALNLQANFTIIAKAQDAVDNRVNLLTCFEEDVKVEFGKATQESGEAALKALDYAMTDFRTGLYDVLVCAPIHPDNIKVVGTPFKELTHYIETCLGDGHTALNLYLNDYLRIAIATNHIEMKDIAKSLSKEKLVAQITTLHHTLERDLRISLPRIAVLSLNPTANGEEENTIIKPAIEELEKNGIYAFGPFAADNFFCENQYAQFDAVMAMYHDQGIIPLKTLVASDNILAISGLPIICTAPALSPRYEDAGKNIADENPLRQAIYQATDIFRNRKHFDEPLTNPLRKLYHDKREDSDKARFSNKRKEQEPK